MVAVVKYESQSQWLDDHGRRIPGCGGVLCRDLEGLGNDTALVRTDKIS